MSKVNSYVFEIKDKPGYYSTRHADYYNSEDIKDVRPSKVLKKAIVVRGYRKAASVRLPFERLRKIYIDRNGTETRICKGFFWTQVSKAVDLVD